jgi:hypothetical protein
MVGQAWSGLDIFVSRKDSSGQWSTPINMGYPIKTFHDENSLMVSADGKLGYFPQIVLEVMANSIYILSKSLSSFDQELLPILKEQYSMKPTGKNLSAKFELIDLATGQTIIQSESDPVDGSFLVALPLVNVCTQCISSRLLFYSDHFDLESNQ